MKVQAAMEETARVPKDSQRDITDSTNDQGSPESGWAFVKFVFRHPILIVCCMVANLGAAMYGFDNLALSLCLSMRPFMETFGVQRGTEYIIPAYWQSLWNAISQLSTGIGAYAAGPIADRFGRRPAFAAASIFSFAGVAIVYTASTPGQFLGGKTVNALGLGIALTVGQIYVSEVTPTNLRGVALSAYTISMNLGYMIAASISFNRVTSMDPSAYKLVFAVGWVWPSCILIAALIIPESPYYLVRKNKIDVALRSLRTLYPKSTAVDPILQSIRATVDHEAYIGETASSLECFKGINWRRTRIVLYANGLNQMIGATFINNAPYFLVVAGVSPTNTAMLVEIGIAMAILSSIFTFWGMTVLGRRTMILGGVALAAVMFFIMGTAASIKEQSSSPLWCVGISLQMIWLTIGPAIGPAMAIAGEISAVRLRANTLAVGFLFNYLFSTVWNVVVPYMFNQDQGNLGGKTGWIFFGTSIIALVIVWLEFPETKGLTFVQIDDRFEMRINARDFKTASLTMGNIDDAKHELKQADHVEG